MGIKFGYLIPEFPAQTHIIFWREITLLRDMGVELKLLSTRMPIPGSCPHEFATAAQAETHYVFPPRLLRSTLTLLKRPMGTLRGFGYLAGLSESSLKDRLKRVGFVLCAADLMLACKADGITHIHSQSTAEGCHIVEICRRLGGPSYSLTLHGDLPVYGTDHKSKMANAIFITVVGLHLKKQVMEEVGIPSDRIISTCFGVDTNKWHDAGTRSYEAGRLHMVSVARLIFTKGYQHALAAMRSLVDRQVDVHYSIVGEGPYRPEIEEEIRRLGLADRVTLLGSRSESQIVELHQKADVFVLPSRGLGEAFPSVLLEAMASGLPVVSSIIGATTEIIDPGVEGYLVPQQDEPKLAEALLELAEKPDLRRQMGAAARQRAMTMFDRKVSTERFLDLIVSRTVAGKTQG